MGERQRLAREMHDVLAHSLSGLVLNLEGARLIAARDGAGSDVADAIGRAHRLAKNGLEEARRAIGMLRDDALPGPERLADLAREFEADTGVACRVAVDGEARELGSDARLTLYRVAQEALTNIRKHACPERVEISLTYAPGRAGLTVEDFERPDRHGPPGGGTGYGLTGMRERAELLGGTLAAGPTATGFRVEVWVPA
jgi:signal transduction histidine kinase